MCIYGTILRVEIVGSDPDPVGSGSGSENSLFIGSGNFLLIGSGSDPTVATLRVTVNYHSILIESPSRHPEKCVGRASKKYLISSE